MNNSAIDNLIINTLSHIYDFETRIGDGGNAYVYKVFNRKNNRTAALKVLKPTIDLDATDLQRFFREAQVIAASRHTNIVKIYDGNTINGIHYLELELIDGQNLHEYINHNGRLNETETFEILLPIIDAVAALHSSGIFHRDIKSSNIIIDKNRRPILLDFGTAFIASSERLTRKTSDMHFTPHFSSPELMCGEDTDERTDIYSLGAILFHCLTGNVLFSEIKGLALISYAVENPAPDINSIIPGLRNETVTAVNKCLKTKASLRFRTAKQLKQALLKSEKEPSECDDQFKTIKNNSANIRDTETGEKKIEKGNNETQGLKSTENNSEDNTHLQEQESNHERLTSIIFLFVIIILLVIIYFLPK